MMINTHFVVSILSTAKQSVSPRRRATFTPNEYEENICREPENENKFQAFSILTRFLIINCTCKLDGDCNVDASSHLGSAPQPSAQVSGARICGEWFVDIFGNNYIQSIWISPPNASMHTANQLTIQHNHWIKINWVESLKSWRSSPAYKTIMKTMDYRLGGASVSVIQIIITLHCCVLCSIICTVTR